MDVIWTEYMNYRVSLRNFNFIGIEDIVKHSSERYYDMTTQRLVVVGRHGHELVVIPYEVHGDKVTPVTIHVTTRQQINFRLRTGRYRYE